MNRQQKINIIIDILAGVPVKFAITKDKYKILYKNRTNNNYQTATGETVTESEKNKYLNKSIIFVDVRGGR